MAVETDIVAVAAPTGASDSYVDWPAIFAGIVLAVALGLVMLTFGSAIGLSMVNFSAAPDVSPVWVAIAAGTWLLWVEVSCAMAGGYLTGRMRRRMHDATEHESDVRDGAHGLLVWAGATIVAVMVALTGLGAAVNTAGSAAATVTQAASNVAEGGIDNATAYFTDALFRPAAPAAGAAATPTPPAAVGTAVNISDARGEAARILTQSAANGAVSDADKAYLAQIVAGNTGLSQADAQARVDQVLADAQAAKDKAAAAAETARKTSVLAAFLTAASFLVAAAGAYWAASMGGRHRDEGTVFADVFRRY
ncbi:hypothetical protein GCM10011321_34790 [Youhaiella tibetensis]|uniref:Uncharacterized protein n=1 Tax=Paradevosia tibetensis TaxID=1447062 RepID=A0A5B9DV32_9HYPH|nr:hypothetical protein [Youhaiella tibetensis]QEE22559.1 hypothetical protein FNA67_21380 [Youhaiella tibetensis]GGF41119.1 hypothetical protein GCM10011321_34790 [Youhaiella tibetensis]